MNEHVIPPSRRPIVIADRRISAGRASATVRPDDAEALLRDYLRLIRRIRNQQRARNIALRRVDIDALAGHLGWTSDQVLARLADLMGATRQQRATMLAVLATGAALITVASPLSAAASGSDATALEQTEPPVVIDGQSITTLAVPHLGVGVGRPIGRVDPGDAVMPSQVREPTPDRSAPRDGSADHDAVPPSSEPAVGPDGATVAVGRAPVPPAPAPTGTDADGNTFAVGRPPVPSTPAPTAAPPPAPEAPAVDVPETIDADPPDTATDADGNTVAVGRPPVPPEPDA